jgi:hypothetical protein
MFNSCNTLLPNLDRLVSACVTLSNLWFIVKRSSALNSRIQTNLDCHVLRVQAF